MDVTCLLFHPGLSKVGGGNTARCIHGGASFVMPMVQDYAYLNLEPIQIEVPLKRALSAENIRVNVPGVFTVAIGTELELMQNAAIRLLGLNIQEVKRQAGDIIFGQLRQVIASMQIQAGTWDFFSEDNFSGENMRLAPGAYPELAPEWSKRIGSFMCLQGS